MQMKTELEDAIAARNGAEQGELIARTECQKQARRAAEVRLQMKKLCLKLSGTVICSGPG
jgi:hypothetical protein